MIQKNLDKLKLLLPMEELESGAQDQIYAALELDFLKTLVIMPDCHTGYTLPIGGVALLEDVISPEYVGYDIGCGMSCVTTPLRREDLKPGRRKEIFNEIYHQIPVGFNCLPEPINCPSFCSASGDRALEKKVNDKLRVQLGTLGSGNHFIEIGLNRAGYLAVVIHSGSRNIGHSIASYYMALSKKESPDLPDGFLRLDSGAGYSYLEDMNFALQYALHNRERMLNVVLDILGLATFRLSFINENHNHAIVQGQDVLHRKGATPADKKQLGVIPGNMRDGTYITEGLGNEEFLCSASHGAGRVMGRKHAKRVLDMGEFQKTMENVVARVEVNTLDEAPMAYKDLHRVVERQRGIVVNVIDYIKPLINIKG